MDVPAGVTQEEGHTLARWYILIILAMHDEGGGISHEEAEGLRTRNKNERMRGTMDAGEDGR